MYNDRKWYKINILIMEQIGNIHIIEAEDNFKRVHKSIIENDNIDCETLGVYTRIIVLGLKWNLNVKGLSSHLGLSDTRIRKAISLLEKEGYIVRTSVKGDGGKFLGWDYKVLPTPIDESQRSNAGKRTSQKPDTPLNGQHRQRTTPSTDNTENEEENNNRLKGSIDLKDNKNKDYNEFIEKMYKLYPTKCPCRNMQLGKSNKDKDRIKKLLKIYSMEQIEKVIKNEIETKYGKTYMQNFSTFLNNFPDPNCLFGGVGSKEEQKADKLVIDGVVYQ